ncbi:hypothetical protein GGS20DRAFT_337717 [Poronia punctata]|nr:hypothetical protein GGS20DRAFT_337717 [Poronia punctata]
MWSFGTTMTMPKDHESVQEPTSKPHSRLSRAEDTIPQAPSAPAAVPPPPPVDDRSVFSQRSLKQLGVFFAGAGFLALSTLVTRRSIARKRLETIPRYFTPSNQAATSKPQDNSLIAFEALSLATLNVFGFGIMLTGGLSWGLDFCNVDDLRRRTRQSLYANAGTQDKQAEKELEEWVAKILSRKEDATTTATEEEKNPTKENTS